MVRFGDEPLSENKSLVPGLEEGFYALCYIVRSFPQTRKGAKKVQSSAFRLQSRAFSEQAKA